MREASLKAIPANSFFSGNYLDISMDRSVCMLLLTVLCSLSIRAQAQVGHTPVTGQRVVCTNGFAAGFPCRNIDLLAFLPLSDLGLQVNDLWGWTDPETGGCDLRDSRKPLETRGLF